MTESLSSRTTPVGAETEPLQLHRFDEKGQVYTIAVPNIKEFGKEIEKNKEVLRTLQVAAKILKGEELDAADKPYKKTAKKVVEFYKKSTEKTGEKPDVKVSSHGDQMLQGLVKSYIATHDNSLFDVAQMAKWIELNVSKTVGADTARLHAAGKLVLLDGKKGVYAEKQVAMEPLEDPEEDKRDKKTYIQRVSVMLDLFKGKICKKESKDSEQLDADIKSLIEDLQKGKQAFEKIFQSHIERWTGGSPAEQNLARLMNGMRQEFRMNPGQAGFCSLINPANDPTHPSQLIDLKGTTLAISDYGVTCQFTDRDVTITQEITYKDQKAKGDSKALAVTEKVQLHANLDALSHWDVSVEGGVSATKKEDVAVATDLHRIYTAAGIKSTLTVIHAIDGWKEALPKSFGKIADGMPTVSEFCKAIGILQKKLTSPSLQKLCEALNDYEKSPTLANLSKAEHAIYDWFSENGTNVDNRAILSPIMHTLELIQAEYQKQINRLVEEGADFPPSFIRSLTPGESVKDVQQLWRDVVAGDKGFKVSDKIPALIDEEDGAVISPEKTVAGFREEMLAQAARLMTTPTGRELLRSLMKNPGHPVEIRPRGGSSLQAGQYKPEKEAHTADGVGTSGSVSMPPGMKDTRFTAHKQNKSDILFPGFIMIGHELGHAVNGQLGRAKTQDKSVDPAWVDLEEKMTIENVENALRVEHGLPLRFGVTGGQT